MLEDTRVDLVTFVLAVKVFSLELSAHRAAKVEMEKAYFGGKRRGRRGWGAAGKIAVFELFGIGSIGEDSVVLDFFAGSGKTGHAVINLNREDGGRRKFILAAMVHDFDTVPLPRIKKVSFTPEWKDGKPTRMATQEETERFPRIIEVIRLECYEYALNNLTFDDESGQKALELFRDDYLLHDMLRWETRHSETVLDVEKLQSGFSYKLRLYRDGETRERLVDLPETFNYLLGSAVQTRKVYYDHGRRYMVYRGALRNRRHGATIWRETQGWTKDDYERDRDFVVENELTEGADEVFVNAFSLIPDAQSLDPIFKERMFAGVEVWYEPSRGHPKREAR